MTFFPVHAHTQFSTLDGLGSVKQMVQRVAELGQPAVTLTDHGTMAGAVQLYQQAKKHDLAPFIGQEFYVVRDVNDHDTRSKRYHLGMMALDFKGYQALVSLTTLSWREDRFYYKPLIDLSDLAYLHDEGYSDSIAVTTGCYSGLVVQALVHDGPDKAEAMVRMLHRWFPNTLYVELQDHGIDWTEHGLTDADIAMTLGQIAYDNGIPVVLGGDSHYVFPGQQPVHDLMKDICYFGDSDDVRFSGGPYHLLDENEAEKASGVWWPEVEEGHADLLSKHALSIPALDTFKFHVPVMVKDDPDKVLSDLVMQGLADRGLDYVAHLTRAQDELDVIRDMGFPNYFLLVKEHVTDWCRDNGIIINARGSVNGSLVAMALGITNVDPLQWHTSFDRFLSRQRKKAPDVDIDVSFRGRGRLVEHLRAVFPSMTQVGTYAQIGMTEKQQDDGSGEDKGSVFVQYMAANRKRLGDAFDGKVRPEDRKALEMLADTPAYKSMGTNAAGFILPGDGLPIDKYLPLGRIISSDTTLTQYNKDDVEALGYVKMDVLGLRALETLNGTLRLIGKQPNDWGWIPLDDTKACALIRSGNGVGLFQFEGYSSQMGAKEMKVKSTLDCILALALYRPALMNGGQKDLYLANRARPRAQQDRLAPLFDPVVKDTAGVPLYQEQIMEMLQTLGMAFTEYNDLMTAIKASNGFIQGAADTFDRLMPLFYDLCEDKGLSYDEADDAWGAVIGFTEYGFNRAHSTSYGLMAYWSAYLKAHYPLEYMASLMEVWTGEVDKERKYVRESKRLGFKIVKADVNHSDVGWAIDPTQPDALRKGLASLPGIGEPTALVIVEKRADGPYTSVQDFVDRTPRRPVSGGRDYAKKGTLIGVCKILDDQLALRSLTP